VIDTSTFNIRHYLRFFDRLHLKPEFEFASILLNERAAALPVLYVREKSFDLAGYLNQALKNYLAEHPVAEKERTQDFENAKKYELACAFAMDPRNKPRPCLVPEDSKEGYLQLLYFDLFGDQFALVWHANHGQKSVIFSRDEANRLYRYYSGTDLFSCDLAAFEKLCKGNLRPVVRMDRDRCRVTWYEILTHQGIYRRTYEIMRSRPYETKIAGDVEILKIRTQFIY
jgi:hypothetical protein